MELFQSHCLILTKYGARYNWNSDVTEESMFSLVRPANHPFQILFFKALVAEFVFRYLTPISTLFITISTVHHLKHVKWMSFKSFMCISPDNNMIANWQYRITHTFRVVSYHKSSELYWLDQRLAIITHTWQVGKAILINMSLWFYVQPIRMTWDNGLNHWPLEDFNLILGR